MSQDALYDRLIEAVAQHRDRQAFAQLFAHFAPRLKTWLMKSGASAQAAEDFAQDAMLTVWRKADLFDASRAGAAAWIFAIARNRRLDLLRREARTPPLPELDPCAPESEQPDALLASAQAAARLRGALGRLQPDQAEVLRLAFMLEHPHSEVARRLGLPLGTVKSRIRTGLLRLRQMLEAAPEASPDATPEADHDGGAS
ncbi:sigma-70 family RNA polymerase sigma factor [Phenylobacterium soli]|uniref:RNA polymerase subunit sigma n=1 Tax=Phenylobacterium soli TaxID=2170551 RepID=A0A328ANN3_9CAUL|nr:sigma-70 family RNA polymerase sigma factor [Phenylobacterium soli]RAK54458.1 RNA polymerase subunit sigma [Phenylobacterium soli]